MKIYVASSWRNKHQPEVVNELLKEGHDVYDYKNNPGVFRWEDIDKNYTKWSKNPEDFVKGLNNHLAKKGFECDMTALEDCDALVYIMPCGPSASMELGYAVGAKKLTIVYIPELKEPDLMIKMANHITTSLEEVKKLLYRSQKNIESNWLYKRLAQASNMVNNWDKERQNNINYIYKEDNHE